jgi:hypothetical protein
VNVHLDFQEDLVRKKLAQMTVQEKDNVINLQDNVNAIGYGQEKIAH